MSRRRPDTTDAPGRPCPCGKGGAYAECCAPLHRGTRSASSAEELMRSRYSAFAVGDAAYVKQSWHPSTRPRELDLDPAMRWTGLEILSTTGGTAFHTEGTVEFRASYRHGGAAGSLHEKSRFTRHEGRWTYVDGDVKG
ncbi:YchJ family protein [Nocardiopsis baichengensis]|uniref:YchJ family protein n=1 Tax=Nocardiopsis baichengensis TaxID=280240 RepID=UPI000593CDE9|nr:YchJ family protein [Nocardiopsis baichengensis]